MPTLYHEGDRPIPGHSLLQFLGEGGFGEVWKAVNPHKIEVALKIVQIQGKQGLREVLAIRLLRNVRHPNLIPIFGFWLKDQEGNILEHSASDTLSGFALDGEYQFFLAMGLGDKSLSDRLKECTKEGLSGIPLEELMQYMEESARALDFLNAAAHNMGGNEKSSIEHCDIKPQNLMLVGGSVQICDFGLARVLQHGVKQQHSASFSHHYVAPELLKRELGPTRGTDQYSLAISYYQLRTGRLPFGDVSFAPAILTSHLEGNLDFSLVPQREQTVLRQATALKPELRFPNVRAFIEALRQAFGAMTKPPKLNLAGLKGPLRPGLEIVPGYKLEELIGRGSFGEVWRASAPGRMKKALKIIRNLDLASSRQEMRSLELITEVRHPHLLSIESYYLLDAEGDLISDEARDEANAPKADTLVIVSELAESHLGALLQRCYKQTGQGISPQELLVYMQQVAAALDRLNSQHDIIHRDVKPENILLVSGVAKLADFGLAKALEGSSALVHTKSIGMTPAYAAPELCNSRIEENTDQYSLALTYYHLRTGHLATGNASDLSELIMAHLANKLTLDGVPPAEEKVLRRGAALESRQRFPSCTAFVQALATTFSRSQMPNDWQADQQAERLSPAGMQQGLNQLNDPQTSIEWEKDSNQEYRALAVQIEEAETSTDTVKKLTDTAREAAKHNKSTQKKPEPAPKTVPAKTKRAQPRRSVGRRLIASVFLFVLFVAASTGFVLIISRSGRDHVALKTESQSGETVPIPKASVPTIPETKPETKPEVNVDVLIKQASTMVQSNALEAFEMLRQIAERLTNDSTELQGQILTLAALCYQNLPQVESAKRIWLKEKYSHWATEHIEALGDGLQQDKLFQPSRKEECKHFLSIAELADQNNPWVCALLIESYLHETQTKSELLTRSLEHLESQTDSQLGAYRQYLRGAAWLRLQQPDKAALAFSTLSPTSGPINWENRRAEIITVLQSAFDQNKKVLLQCSWQELLSATKSLQETKISLDNLLRWKTEPASGEEKVITFLATTSGPIRPEQTKTALGYARENKLADLDSFAVSLRLAFLSRYSTLLMQADESPEEAVFTGHLFIETLAKAREKLTDQERYQQLHPFVLWSKQSSRLDNLSIKPRQKLAELLFWHGQILVVNAFETWHGEQHPMAAAREDFKTAILFLNDLENAERLTIKTWKALVDHELNDPNWGQELDFKKVELASLDKLSQAIVLLLNGEKQLADGRNAKTQEVRLKVVEEAKRAFDEAVKGFAENTPANWYLLGLAHIGQSKACLEYANYLHNEDEHLVEERKNLEQAERAARSVTQDSKAKPLQARALIALGNALEDFGLLLKENRNSDAANNFDAATRTAEGKPQRASAQVNLARVMIRSNDETKLQQAEKELRNALGLVKEGDEAAAAHFWLASIYEKRKDYDAAETAYRQAVAQATIPYFKDPARCEAFDVLLKKPIAKPYESTIIQRINLIERDLPKPESIDPQVRKRAELLRIKGLSVLGNLHFWADRINPDQQSDHGHLKKVKEEIALLLQGKPSLAAELNAARLQAKVLVTENHLPEALKETAFAGKLDALIKEWQTKGRLENAFLEEAVLDLCHVRFEFFWEKGREQELLKKYAAESIDWADRLCLILDKKNDYYFLTKGQAGFMRSWVLRFVTDEELKTVLKNSTEVKWSQDAKNQLQEALDKLPQSNLGWQWAFALYGLSVKNNKASAITYLETSVRLAKAAEVDKQKIDQLEEILKTLK